VGARPRLRRPPGRPGVLLHEEPLGTYISKDGKTCYGQIQDAGPGQYNDADYVFGTNDRRPKNTKFNSAGMDVSPALNGCLGFTDLNGDNDHVDWRFVEPADVPGGPWRTLVTTSGVTP
jgi:hypothetical protein